MLHLLLFLVNFPVFSFGAGSPSWWSGFPPWIDRTDLNFDIPSGAYDISTANHSGVVVCLFNLVPRTRWSPVGVELSFDGWKDLDGDLCTHVIMTSLVMQADNLWFRENDPMYVALSNVSQLRAKYPKVKFLIAVDLRTAYTTFTAPPRDGVKPFYNPTDSGALANNLGIFLNNMEWLVKHFDLQGVHLRWGSPPFLEAYRSTMESLKSRFADRGYILTTDPLNDDYKSSKLNQLFDLVLVATDGRNDEELAAFFFEKNKLNKSNNFVLQVNMFGFTGDFHPQHGTVSRFFIDDLWGYNEICQIARNTTQNLELLWDDKNEIGIVSNGSWGIVINTPRSILIRTRFAVEAGFRGVMIRSTHEDDFKPWCGNVTFPLSRCVNLAISEAVWGSRFCYHKYRPYMESGIISEASSPTRMYSLINSTVQLSCAAITRPAEGRLISWVNLHDKSMLIEGVEVTREDTDCPQNVTRTSNVTLVMDSVGKNEFQCHAKSEGRNATDRFNFSVIVQPKPYILKNGSLWIEEVELDLNFTLPPDGKIRTWTDQTTAFFCQINAFPDLAMFLTNHSSRLELCSHLVLGQMDFDQMKQIPGIIRKMVPLTKILLQVYPTIELSWLRNFTATEQRINFLIKELGLDGLHVIQSPDASQTFSGFVDSVNIIRNILEDFSSHVELSVSIITPDGNMLRKSDFAPLARVNYFVVKSFNFDRPSTAPSLPQNSPKGRVNFLETSGLRNVVLEVPAFGYSYELATFGGDYFGLHGAARVSNHKNGYKEICQAVNQGGNWSLFWDHVTKTHFLKNGDTWIAFESLRSIYGKLGLFGEHPLKGVMLTGVELDDFNGACSKTSILEFIHEALKIPANSRADSTANPPQSLHIIWSVLAVFLVLIVATGASITFITLRLRHIRNQNNLSAQDMADFFNGRPKLNPSSTAEFDPYELKYNPVLEIKEGNYHVDRSDILGSGAYGIVYRGTVDGVGVAVKTLKPGVVQKDHLLSLLSELKILSYVGNHPNIVGFIGAATAHLKQSIVYVFVEYCKGGNLKTYLKTIRPIGSAPVQLEDLERNLYENVLTLKTLYRWALQLCQALEHLASIRVIHGDIAARNVLVFDNDTVKITDFGLSRKLYNYSFYKKKKNQPLPWAWMALESLTDQTFSTESDIWSLGVTLWEMFSLGETPYAIQSWNPEFVELLKSGYRLSKPAYATVSVYEFMEQFWKFNPNERPTPSQGLEFFANLLDERETGYWRQQVNEGQDCC